MARRGPGAGHSSDHVMAIARGRRRGYLPEMPFQGDVPRFLCLNTIKAGADTAFEAFVRDEIVPAVAATRPHQVDQWVVLAPDAPNDDGTSSYAFVFYGDSTFADWDLPALLGDAHGPEDADAKMATFGSLLEAQAIWGFSGPL